MATTAIGQDEDPSPSMGSSTSAAGAATGSPRPASGTSASGSEQRAQYSHAALLRAPQAGQIRTPSTFMYRMSLARSDARRQ